MYSSFSSPQNQPPTPGDIEWDGEGIDDLFAASVLGTFNNLVGAREKRVSAGSCMTLFHNWMLEAEQDSADT
jgi:hypothetical protein